MKKVVLFYFSGTGNTWWTAKTLARLLTERGISCQWVSVESLPPQGGNELAAAADAVGFAYPTYGSDLPIPMQKFIDGLISKEGKPAFVICTQWLWSGDGARVGGERAEGQGFSVNWGEHILMPNNICTYPWLPYTSGALKIRGVLKRAEKRLARLADRIADGSPRKVGFNPISTLLGSIQRIPFRKHFPKYQDSIGVAEERCIDCRACQSWCPATNIEFVDGQFTTNNRCLLCMRCYNFCPVSAITFMGAKHIMRRGLPYRGPVEGLSPQHIQDGKDR